MGGGTTSLCALACLHSWILRAGACMRNSVQHHTAIALGLFGARAALAGHKSVEQPGTLAGCCRATAADAGPRVQILSHDNGCAASSCWA